MYGLLFLCVSLIIFFLATLFLKDRNTSHAARFFNAFLTFCIIILSGAYLVSDYFTDSGIDESVLFHLMYGPEGSGFSELMLPMFAAGVFVIVAGVAAFIVFRILKPVPPGEMKARLWLAHLTLPAAIMLNPGTVDVLNVTAFNFFSKPSQLSFSRQYQKPSLGSYKKETLNLVFVYLESLERTYFDETLFPGLITRLRELENESLTFTNIHQVFGTDWTIAGMTASQCGIPLVTSSLGNSMSGMDRFLSGATCMGDVLNERGYDLTYMGGSSLDFAGKGKFYSSHGFSDLRGKAVLLPTLQDPSYRTGWGLFDDSLLDRAYERFESLAASGTRFGLFMLTLDTHHPKGHPSKQCAGKVYRDGKNPVLNAVLCSDFLVSEFVRKIRNSPYASNTLIVIASDHLAFPNTAWDKLQEGDRKNLLLVIDPKHSEYSKIVRAGSTLDIAPTVLSMLGYDVPAFGLGRDLLGSSATLVEQVKEPSKTLKGWRQQLAGFWDYPSIKEGVLVDGIRKHIRIADRVIKVPALLTLTENMAIEGIKFEFYSDKELISYVDEMPSETPFLWVDSCKKLKLFDRQPASAEFCLFAGRMGSDHELTMNVDDEVYLTRDMLADAIGGPVSAALFEERKRRLESMIEFGTDDVIVHKRSIYDPAALTSSILIRSSGFKAGPSFLASKDPGTMRVELTRGVSLIGITSTSEARIVSQIDPCSDGDQPTTAEPFSQVIDQYSSAFPAFAIVVHDSPYCTRDSLNPIFRGLPLTKWTDLRFRQPYIGIIPTKKDKTIEILGKKGSAIGLMLSNFAPTQ